MNMLDKKQKGFVSFLTVMFLSVILVLITTAFVKTMTSNQRQTLDSQLNTQAFYAAESGVNDLLAYVLANPLDIPNYDADCNKIINEKGLDNALNASIGLKYTCLTAKSEVDDIKYDIATNVPKIHKLQSKGPNKFTSINLEWGDSSTQTQLDNTPNLTDLPTIGSWGDKRPPILRVSLFYPTFPVIVSPDLSRPELDKKQITFFLKPRGSGNLITLNSSEDGTIHGACGVASTGYKCKAEIDFSALTGGAVDPYIKISSITNKTKVRISGNNKIIGAQIEIDSTGRANDVYKRIQVRKDIETWYKLPDFVVNTNESLCKQFTAWTGGSADYAAGGCSGVPTTP